MATSVQPSRQGRPKVSEMITAASTPASRAMASLIDAAEASGSIGSSATSPCVSTFDWSTPALAQMKPCRVSVMITPWSMRTTRLLS